MASVQTRVALIVVTFTSLKIIVLYKFRYFARLRTEPTDDLSFEPVGAMKNRGAQFPLDPALRDAIPDGKLRQGYVIEPRRQQDFTLAQRKFCHRLFQ